MGGKIYRINFVYIMAKTGFWLRNAKGNFVQIFDIKDVAHGTLMYVAQAFLLAGSIFGFDRKRRILITEVSDIASLIEAMAYHENGQPIDKNAFLEGTYLALGHDKNSDTVNRSNGQSSGVCMNSTFSVVSFIASTFAFRDCSARRVPCAGRAVRTGGLRRTRCTRADPAGGSRWWRG